MTEAGSILGTPGYMAPEQYLAQPTDARSDQFSFCVSLYEGLYGVRPFHGATFAELSASVVEGRVDDTPSGSRVPSWIRRILLRGLSTDPANRYPSLDALLGELSRDPGTARVRAATAMGSVAGLAGLMLLVWHTARVHGTATCTGAQAEMDEVWNPAMKQQVEHAFTSTGASFAPDSWHRAGELLDRYASRWVAAHRTACEATRLRAEQPEAIMALRMTCLEQRRDQMRALAQTLAEADRQVVEKSVEAIGALPSVTDCEDVTSLTTVKPMPSQPEQRASIEALRREVASAQVLFDAGKYAKAAAQAAPLAERARTLGYEPVVAEALLVQGEAQDRSASKAEATVSLRQAANAADAGRADDLRVRALAHLIPILADIPRIGEARETMRAARAASSRLADAQAFRAELDSAEAWILYSEGKYAESLTTFRSAIAAEERSADPNAIRIARLYARASGPTSSAGDTDGATAMLEHADALFVQVQGADFPGRVSVQINKSVVLLEAERPTEALTAVDLGLEIAARALPPESASFPILFNNRSEALLQLGRDSEALETATRATDLARKAFGEKGGRTAECQLDVGAALRHLGRFDEAVSVYHDSLTLLESTLPADHPFLFEGRLGLSETELARGNAREATALLERALQARGAENQAKSVRLQVARAHEVLARALSNSGASTARVAELTAQAASEYRALGHEDKAVSVEASARDPQRGAQK
jgi:tetratricopeptide (TPR) repeat protein